MQQYLQLVQKILDCGDDQGDRTGVGTRGIFGAQLRFDLRQGFPLVTTKKIFFKAIVAELLWMLSGSTNVRPLQVQGVRIWDEWADAAGDLGPVYGKQWRSWPTTKFTEERGETDFMGVDYTIATPVVIDQIANLIEGLRKDPFGRRHIVSAWNPAELADMALPPCHALFQFKVSSDKRLSCQLYQRSADMFLGVPFNIASYALLTHMVAQVVGLEVGEFIWTGGDCHIYNNHFKQMRTQLKRIPLASPRLALAANVTDIFDFTLEDVFLSDYVSHPSIKGEVAV